MTAAANLHRHPSNAASNLLCTASLLHGCGLFTQTMKHSASIASDEVSQIDFDEFLCFHLAVEWSKHFKDRSENATQREPREISNN
jgi:hypothetical protein